MMEATHNPSWGFNPDFSQINPRQGEQNVDNPQRQNPTMYDAYGYTQMPLAQDSFVRPSNGFIQPQPQFLNGTYLNQPSIAMASGAAPLPTGMYSVPNPRTANPLDGQSRYTQSQPEQRHFYPNPAASFNAANQQRPSPPYQNASAQPILNAERSAPVSQQASNGQQYMYPAHAMGSGGSPMSKRPRPGDAQEEAGDDEREMERERMRPQGACSRCKNLKVKCEFRTDTDPCRRCLNAGADCQIPGRKKRRTPPKREHLLNQIREQAAQIEHLMAQLEKGNHPASSPKPHSEHDLTSSPALSPSAVQTPASSYFGHSPAALTHPELSAADNQQDIENWIAKARESLAQFGGIIGGMGGNPKQKLVADQEESDDDVGFYTGDEGLSGEYEFAVVNSDDEGDLQPMRTNGNRLAHRHSSSNKKATASHLKHAALPTETSAIGLFAHMSLGSQREEEEKPEQANAVGVASITYFRESPGPEGNSMRSLNAAQVHAPQILKRGIVTTIQVEQLFDIYYKYMNLSLSLLDPILYTPQTTFWRSPFLFTAICAIASRYYPESKDLYPQCMHFAQLSAAESLISGTKNVEMASAYILLSLYPVPARRWEDDRSWLYLGLAIRVATDLSLHKPPAKAVNESHAREMLNRTRVWLNCFNLDRSTGSQHGKTPTIRNTDYMACHSEDWWRQSSYNIRDFDIHLCCYNAELRVMSRFVAKVHSDPSHPTGFDKTADCERLAADADDELTRLGEKWFAMIANHTTDDPQSQFRTALLRLAYSYARLASLSYAFQQASTKSKVSEENPLTLRCLRAATDVVNSYLQNVAKPSQLIYLRHGPEAQCVFVTFASAFLVKLLHPKYAKQITPAQRHENRRLVESVIAVLGSPEVAIDDHHAPKLYARFLQGLLDTPMAKADISSPTSFANALPRNYPRKAKTLSKSPQSDRIGLAGMHLSPDPNTSPSLTNVSFDGTQQSFGQATRSVYNFGTNQSTPETFLPPLPFDNDLLSSMQQFTEPGVWADYTALAGMSWMSNYQDDSQMMADSLIFNNYSTTGSQG